MAFLRRGHVRVPHKKDARILLHRIDGSPVYLTINDISHWEEHRLPNTLRDFTTIWYGLNSIAVQETFDRIDGEVNREAVTHEE